MGKTIKPTKELVLEGLTLTRLSSEREWRAWSKKHSHSNNASWKPIKFPCFVYLWTDGYEEENATYFFLDTAEKIIAFLSQGVTIAEPDEVKHG